MDKPLIVIAGATATGKTKAAIMLAKRIGGEIISADSMQVYKYMDIGTAKPSVDEMQGIPHYMIDEVLPDEEFNVSEFKKRAERYIDLIRERGKIPIVAGGTGFYINALIKKTEFADVSANPQLRSYFEGMAKKEGNFFLHDILKREDSKSAEKIHPNNVKRVIRALEYYRSTGSSIADHNKTEKAKMVNDEIYYFILDMDREKLYERINIRVDIMIKNGLVDEVKSLMGRGYADSLTSMQGIGYKEIINYFNYEFSLCQAIDKIKQGSRNYAKRQVTWFKNQTNGKYIDAEKIIYDNSYFSDFVELVQRNLEG